MDNQEILFKKIEEKGKEWRIQVEHLQSKVVGFDFESRAKIEEQIGILNMKLKEIEQRTNELKETSKKLRPEIGDKLIHSWIESLTQIDNAILKLKD